MRVSHGWLSELVDLEGVPPARVAELLTLSGTEVERVVEYGRGLDQVVVGEVVGLRRLTGSDHLFLADVRLPGQEPREVVCGAGNLFLGALVPWARPGTTLPTGLEIGRRKIRGSWSEGMLCAPDELGLGTDHLGVLILPGSEAEAGQPLADLYPLDFVYDLEILSNRADCLSHWGVARELAALLRRPLQDPDTSLPVRAAQGPEVAVLVEDAADCPLYLAECLLGVGDQPAPPLVRQRLAAVGQRSLGGVVDLANYVMLEVGQPLHTFDLDRLPNSGGRVEIGVRRGRPGETLSCLDGEERTLDPATLVITAADRPQAIAGMIGGEASAVRGGTTSLLLEAANFNWTLLRSTSRRLGLRTEASSRFERRLSPHLASVGAARFLRLACSTLGATLTPGPSAFGVPPPAPLSIQVDSGRVSALLGRPLSPAEVAAPLRALQFEVEEEGEGRLRATPPAVRTDVTAPVDVVEEVGRILGYQDVEGTIPPIRQAPPVDAFTKPVARLVSELCLGAGLSEAITVSLLPLERSLSAPRLWTGASPLALANPLSAQLGALRVGLLAGLLVSIHQNQARGQERVRLFEQGAAFWGRGEGAPEEPWLLGVVDLGDDAPEAAGQRVRGLLALCGALASRGGGGEVEFRPASWPGMHPLRAAELWSQGALRGVVGELDARVTDAFDLRGRVAVAELRLDGWLVPGGRKGMAPPLPRTPALVLDLAVVVPRRAGLGPALDAVAALQVPELEQVLPVDEYQGSQLDPELKGWTLRLWLRDPERTLTRADGEQVRQRVLAALEREADARLR